MLSMGLLGHYLTYLAGPGTTRRVSVRFANMVRLGDELTCRGHIVAVETQPSGRVLARLEIRAENQRGETVTAGEADVLV